MELSDEDVGLASQITKPKQVELSDADVFGAPAQPVAELSDADVFGTPDAPAMPKEASGMLAGAGSAMVRGYQDTQAQAGIAEKFRLRGYKTALENGGDYETDIGELAMSGKATPAQIDLLRRGVPNTDPVWRQAEIARVTNEMAKLDQSIKDADATIANYPAKSLPYQELQAGIEAAKKEGRPIMGTLESLWNNPAGVPEFVAEGAYGTAKPIAGAIGTALALRRGNAAPLAQTLGPIAVSMGITGLDSYKGEVSQIIEEKARQGGIDLRKNPEMMDGLLTDANFIQAVKTDALKAGLNDAAWAGISTWLGMTPKIKGLWQPVIQSVAEAGTEASKQLVVKGKIDDPSNVIMSGVAGAMFEGPAYGLHSAFAGKAPASPAAATAQAQQQAAVEPQAQTQQATQTATPDVINVDDLPDAPRSVAGETGATPPAEAPVKPTPAGQTPEWLKPAEPAAEPVAQPAPVVEPVAVKPEPAAPVSEAPAPVEQPVQPAAPAPVEAKPEPTPAPAPEPVATAQPEAKPAVAESKKVANARASLAKLEAAGKGDIKQAKALRRTIERETAPAAEENTGKQRSTEPSPIYQPKAQEPSAERDASYKRDVDATPLPKKQIGKVDIAEFANRPKATKDAEIYGDLAIVKGDNGKYGVVHTKTGLYLSQALPKKADAVGIVRAMTHGNVDFNFTDKSDPKWTKSEGKKAAQILIARKNGVSPDFYKAAKKAPVAQPNLRTDAEISPPQSPQVKDAGDLTVRIGDKEYKVASLADASKKWMNVQDEIDNQGLSWNRSPEFADIPNPTVYDSSGKQIGWISQNGTISDGVPGKPKNKLFDPYEGQPDATNQVAPSGEEPIEVKAARKIIEKPTSIDELNKAWDTVFKYEKKGKYAIEEKNPSPAAEQPAPQAEVDPELAKIDALKISDDEKRKIKERYLRDKKNYNRRQRELEASRKLDEASRKAAEESRQLREKEAAQQAEQPKAPKAPAAEAPKADAKPAEESKTAETTPTQADLDGINDKLAEMERNKQGESPEAEALRAKRDAVQSKLDEAVVKVAEKGNVTEQTILESLDKAAAERLDPRNANSLGPDLIAALAWKTARDMQKGLTNFAKWAADTAKKFPALKGQLQTVWDRALQIAKSPMDYIRFRALDSIADKVWQNVRRNADSPTLRKIANIVFAKGGPDANAVENDIPTRVNLVRAQFSNIYANIMERFAAEFAGMDTQQRRQWDVDFRDAVLGRTQPTDPKMVKAVKDYRNLMRDMLAYQRDAGVTVGDQGENYFPRHYDADAVEANRSGFIDVAMDMYRKRDERLLNKAIADVRYNEKERAANRKQADKEAGRKIKTDAEYQAEAAEWADEKIAALEAEHAAKDDDHYKGLAEDWATAITHGDVLGLTLFKNTDGKIKSDATDVRSFSDAEAELADAFLKKNVDDITMGYVDGAVRGSELARVFGEDGKKFEQMMNKLSEEGVDKDTVKETRDLVAKALGVGREQLSQAESVFFDWVNVVLAGAFLGKTFIYNMVLEPISFGVRTGNAYLALKGVAETWKNTIAELSTPSAEMRQRLEQQFGSRAHFEESVNAAVAEQLGLVQKEIERAYLNTHWDYSSDNKGSKTAKWLSQRIYRANMMTATEHAKVRASIAISRLALRDNARFLLGEAPLQKILGKLGMDTRADKSVATIFNENGVPEKDHKAFADWVIGLEGKTDAQWQAAVMGSSPMAKHYRRALQRMSLGMSIKTNPALKMASADSVLGRMLMQLMNYSYAYSNLVKDRMYTMAGATFSKDASKIDRLRYAAPLLVGAPLAVIGAAASKALIGALWPSDEMEEINKKRSFARKAFDASSFAGMFGPKVEYLVKGFERGQLPGGPTAEVVFRGGQAAFASATDPDNAKKGYTFKKQAYNAVVKPAVTGGAAAVHPFFGFLGNAAVNTQGAREAVIGDKPKK